ncbi:MAG: imidazole glycerol phosphate synthase subunit HisH [Thiotrichaceae bacterium]
MKTLAVIDDGMSNLRSVSKALEHVAPPDWHIVVTQQPEVILRADKVVFPGQGAIGNCMTLLHDTHLFEVIQTCLSNKPFLGICLGLQTLLTHSEESGGIDGFNQIAGTVQHFGGQFTATVDHKIPHMGWNQVQQQAHPLWHGIPDNSRFYFVHSYFVAPKNPQMIAGYTEYGVRFASALKRDNILQRISPRKKPTDAGLKLLHNFLTW